MTKEKVVFYGLSTEGYSLASQLSINGADVRIIDESTSSAILLKPEVAKTYTNVISLREDEPLLAMEPSNIAISKAKYLFFTPRIRKTGQDLKTEVNSKFKNAVTELKDSSSIINCLPTGFGGNNENISLLKHVTGLEAGKSISYFYFPLNDLNKTPESIGALKKPDENIQNFIPQVDALNQYNQQDLFSAETDIKYLWYERRELDRIKKIFAMENEPIPLAFDYNNVKNYVK